MNPQIRKKYLVFFLVVSLSLSFSGFTQDIHFSQYNLTPMLINPAQAGTHKNPEVIVNYRTYRTIMFTYDRRLMQRKWKTKWLATSLSVFSDKTGDEPGITQVLTSLGYHKQFSKKSTLGGALFGGYVQRGKSGYPDAGVGLLYQYNKGKMYSTANDKMIVHAGFALFHINSSQYSYLSDADKLYMKIVCHADALVGIKETNFYFIPGVTYTHQDSTQEIYMGSFFRYILREQSKFSGFVKSAAIVVGTHFRLNTINKDAFIPTLQLEIAKYMIGLSYDVNIYGVPTAFSGKGGFEIHLRYRWPDPFLYRYLLPRLIQFLNIRT